MLKLLSIILQRFLTFTKFLAFIVLRIVTHPDQMDLMFCHHFKSNMFKWNWLPFFSVSSLCFLSNPGSKPLTSFNLSFSPPRSDFSSKLQMWPLPIPGLREDLEEREQTWVLDPVLQWTGQWILRSHWVQAHSTDALGMQRTAAHLWTRSVQETWTLAWTLKKW